MNFHRRFIFQHFVLEGERKFKPHTNVFEGEMVKIECLKTEYPEMNEL